MIKLALGGSPAQLSKLLSEAVIGLENVRGQSEAIGLFNNYLEWASEQVRLFANLVREEEIDRLITTRRYWTLLTLDPSAVSRLTLRLLVDGEITQRIAYLTAVHQSAKADLARWENGEAEFVKVNEASGS